MTRAPVAFLIFNRPQETARVFARIRQARPRTLLVIADGPRDERDHEQCERARSIVLNHVDWECDLKSNVSLQNLGCKLRVSSGIDWVFDQVDEAIILEDDCLPDPTFFPFCDELLERYRDDRRVMHIGGSNLQFGHRPTEDSYYFSAINQIWGWATWRRAWKDHYDVTMRRWPAVRESSLLKDLLGDDVASRIAKGFDAIHAGATDSWDNQWTLAVWLAGGLTSLCIQHRVRTWGDAHSKTRQRHRKPADGADAVSVATPKTHHAGSGRRREKLP
jgi:hypothetical protein